MSYAVGNCEKHKRHIGYGVTAICDHPDCTEEIDRGLGYLCGEDFHFASCHGYFCEEHRYNYVYGDEIEDMSKGDIKSLGIDMGDQDVLDAVENGGIVCCRHEPVQPNKENAEWLKHVLNDDTWAKWREENPKQVTAYQKALENKQGNVCFVLTEAGV